LTADFTDNVSNAVWSPDGKSIVFRAIDNDTYDEAIYRYTLADEELAILARGEESYGNIVATNDGAMVTIQSATTPSDLWRIDAAGQRHRLTDLNPWLRTYTFAKPELFHFDNADGERLGALLYLPVGANHEDAAGAGFGGESTADTTAASATGAPSSAPGLITYIYEKLTPGRHRFSARNQMLISHGYALLMPNVKIKVGETGTSYVKSVVPAVEAVRAMGVTNGEACLWGGSFGAYGTSFVITQTNIFACAVSRATPPELFRNWASGRDRDSNNIESGQARMGGSPFEYQERYIAQSAFFHLDQVETPVLIMHGVKDYTILFGEGEMFFYALRRLGKVAEFVIYNEGDHSLSRHSREDTLDVNRRMLEWFERYLR
jgi:dipeptidyl aminopeptidase/acylaminoacyl peptidase